MGGNGNAFDVGSIAILERIAGGATPEEALEAIVLLIERSAPGTLCTVLVLDEAGETLRHGAAPSLPKAFVEAIDGSRVGPEAGSCGAAAFRKELVVVTDIGVDPRWKDYRDLALPHGLLACWSIPVMSSAGQVLGTFAMYMRERRGPTDVELALVTSAAHLASIALLHARRERALRESEERASRLARLYAVTSSVGEVMLHVRDPQELFASACRIAVEKELAALAWIGVYDEQSDEIVPRARFGRDDGYVDQVVLRLRDPEIKRGPAAQALVTNLPAVTADIERDADFHWRDAARARGLRSCLVVPLRYDRGARGVLALYAGSANAFGPEEVRALTVLAGDIAFAVESARATTELAEREERLRLLHELAQATRSDGGGMLPMAMGLLGRHLGVSRCAYAIFEEDGDTVRVEHSYAAGVAPMSGKFKLSDFGPRIFAALRSGEPFVVRDTALDLEPEVAAQLRALDIRSFASWSLVRRGRPKALVAVHHVAPRDWTPHELALVGEIADRCWSEIEQRSLEAALRAKEEQLRQAQKLEAVGRLAGGIAHDFNNMLSVILSYAAVLADGLSLDDPMRADLDEIREAGERAAELTRQLLAFSRQQVLRPRRLDLSRVTRGFEKILRRVVGEGIVLSLLTPAEVGTVIADPGQVEQILMNLAVNARDAMPTGGSLTIEVADAHLDAAYAAAHHDVVAGAHVVLSVTDTGHGMDEATRARLFEPFFTTKPVGKGTGLGLATVYGIVVQSGGHIWVYSEPGHGTTFRVYFPAVDGPHDAEAPADERCVDLRGSETVLAVEDNDQLRAVLTSALRRAGYNVLEAQNGGEALLVSEQFAARIDLLLTDVVMPRMTGPDLARRMRGQRPGMRVLFMSGYSADSVVQHGVVDAGMDFIQKPITPSLLLRRIREVLRAPLDDAPAKNVMHVDDDDDVLHLTARVLRGLGYRVTSFGEPREALAALRAAPRAFDALVTDVSMTGMSGFSLAKEARAIRDDIAIVVTSGHFRPEDLEAATALGLADSLVTKPDAISELGPALRAVLARPPARRT